LNRDITRHDIRELVRRGLAACRGNYRTLLPLFGMTDGDYKRFLNFLATHDCRVDFRTFRNVDPAAPPRIDRPDLLPPLVTARTGHPRKDVAETR
jgi:hypothetical protein